MKDVIESGGAGYRLSDRITVRDVADGHDQGLQGHDDPVNSANVRVNVPNVPTSVRDVPVNVLVNRGDDPENVPGPRRHDPVTLQGTSHVPKTDEAAARRVARRPIQVGPGTSRALNRKGITLFDKDGTA